MSKSTEAERAAQRDAKMVAIAAHAIPPASSDEDLKQAARRLVEQIEQIAQAGKDHLAANPALKRRYEDLTESEKAHEDDLRELAAAVNDEGWRGLVPLFEALSAEMGATRYGHGLLLRFLESVLDAAMIAGVDAIKHIRRGRSQGGKTGGGKAARERAEKWMAEALPLAQANQELSQGEISEKIVSLVRGAPDRPRVEVVLRQWKKAGLLPILAARQKMRT